jgi:hypothetical protein
MLRTTLTKMAPALRSAARRAASTLPPPPPRPQTPARNPWVRGVLLPAAGGAALLYVLQRYWVSP